MKFPPMVSREEIKRTVAAQRRRDIISLARELFIHRRLTIIDSFTEAEDFYDHLRERES